MLWCSRRPRGLARRASILPLCISGYATVYDARCASLATISCVGWTRDSEIHSQGIEYIIMTDTYRHYNIRTQAFRFPYITLPLSFAVCVSLSGGEWR
ncbi:hypothetical protein AVEN_50531-1 [Araneus ventricosus]|uniref:Uncharacterized protein n=1 Tax=Araneus ventricosus TaxID=182803 RepID=A0A4Y2AS40_ARAVE|nr:hypothetical protein AVEN_50531-1 [Araneus ventricosus]